MRSRSVGKSTLVVIVSRTGVWMPGTGAALRAFIFSELAEGQPYSVDFRPEGPILVDFSARSADFFYFSTHIQWHPRDTPQPPAQLKRYADSSR